MGKVLKIDFRKRTPGCETDEPKQLLEGKSHLWTRLWEQTRGKGGDRIYMDTQKVLG